MSDPQDFMKVKMPKLDDFAEVMEPEEQPTVQSKEPTPEEPLTPEKTQTDRRKSKLKQSEASRRATVKRTTVDLPLATYAKAASYVTDRKLSSSTGYAYNFRQLVIDALNDYIDRENKGS